MNDQVVNALLADYRPPPVPDGLAERVTAAAVARPQDPGPSTRRQPRDRRGGWLRRPLVAGAAAMALLVGSAVAATLAGVELPPKVQSVLAEVPFLGAKRESEPAPAPAPVPAPRHRAEARPAAAPAGSAGQVTEAEVDEIIRRRSERRAERLAGAREIVAARRAAGLPTPRADRVEHRIARRQALLESLPPEERARLVARAAEARRERIRARLEAAPGAEDAAVPGEGWRAARERRLERRRLRWERRQRRRALLEEQSEESPEPGR